MENTKGQHSRQVAFFAILLRVLRQQRATDIKIRTLTKKMDSVMKK